MAKKLGLFLVLSLIMSMLPMNAFGSLPFVSNVSRSFITTSVPHIDADGNRINTLKLNLDAMFYVGRPGFEGNNLTGVTLGGREVIGMTVVIDGPGVWARSATQVLDWGSAGNDSTAIGLLAANHADQPADLLDVSHRTTIAGVLEAIDMRYSVAPVNSKTIYLTFQGNAGAFSPANVGHAVGQYVFLDPTLHIANATGDTVIRIVGSEEIRLTNLIPTSRGLLINVENSAMQNNVFNINRLNIMESMRGDLTNQLPGMGTPQRNLYITLEAPMGFNWVGNWNGSYEHRFANPNVTNLFNPGSYQWNYTVNGLHYLTISIPLSVNNLNDLRLEHLSLHGIALAALGDVDPNENVIIRFTIQYPSTITDDTYNLATNGFVYPNQVGGTSNVPWRAFLIVANPPPLGSWNFSTFSLLLNE
jgi:hypothetical protein